MKKYFSYDHNNNASWISTQSCVPNVIEQLKNINNYDNDLTYSLCNSQTLNMIRSIVDELYEITNKENISENESKEKQVHFIRKYETDGRKSAVANDDLERKQSKIENHPVLSDSATITSFLNEGRSTIDCCVSTDDLPFLQLECTATQTIDIANSPKHNRSLMSLLTVNNDLSNIDCRQSSSYIALSTTSINSKSASIRYTSSLSTTNNKISLDNSLYSCENNDTHLSLRQAHQLKVPTEAKYYNLCQDETVENYNTWINDYTTISNASFSSNNYDTLSRFTRKLSDENLLERNVKFCTCSKRNLLEIDSNIFKFGFVSQDKLLKELHLPKRSLQKMYNDGLFYIRDLALVLLRNSSQFYKILIKRYYLSKNEANILVRVIHQWLKEHRQKFINVNKILLRNNIRKYN